MLKPAPTVADKERSEKREAEKRREDKTEKRKEREPPRLVREIHESLS